MMAKGVNDGKPKRSHNYKPYDTSNSFVKRVASKVSELLPQPISRWLTATSQEPPRSEHSRFDQEEEEEDQRPSKRLCLSQTVNEYTHQNNVGRLNNPCINEGDVSPILSNTLDEYAIPGPSGLHLRKTDNFISSTPAIPPPTQHTPTIEKINDTGDDGSDSSDSTSGCSSLVPQSDKTSSFSAIRTLRTSETPNLSSSLADMSRNQRTFFPKAKYPRVDFSHSSSRGMPVFDPVIFHSPFRSGSANTSLKDDISNASPFYRGRTMYGGASSCREALTLPSPSPSKPEVPRIINIRPEKTITVRDSMSDTTKKILEALEKFSTPVMDAKRIPMKQPSSTGQKRKLPQPYQELSIPQMPDLLRIKRRETQQRNRTLSVESTPSTSVVSDPYPPKKPVEEYSLRDNIHEDGISHVGSIKTKNKDFESEQAPKFNLPNISLPVNSMPVINISLPKPPAPAPTLTQAPAAVPTISLTPAPAPTPTQIQTPASLPPTVTPLPKPPTLHTPQVPVVATPAVSSSFKFSEPISQSVKIPPHTSPAQRKSTYKFSMPLDTKQGIEKKTPFIPNNVQGEKSSTQELPTVNKTESTNTFPIMKSSTSNWKLKRKLSSKNQEEDGFEGLPVATELKSGSVMDLFKPKTSESSGTGPKSTFETSKCKKCNVNIEKDKVECTGCETRGLSKIKQDVSSGVENKLKPCTDKWECVKCSFDNGMSDTKCAKCGQVKGGKVEDSVKSEKEQTTTSSSVPNPLPQDNAGAAPAKPLPLLNTMFKKPAGWECDACLVQNKVDVDTCVACGTLRPGATAPPKEQLKQPTFSFGIPPTSSTETKNGGIAFSFGTNGTAVEETKLASTGFIFGVGKSESKNSIATFKFDSGETTDAKPTFTFGAVAPVNKNDEKQNNTVNATPTPVTSALTQSVGFKFTPNTTTKESQETKPKESTEDKDEQPAKKRVSFGEPLTQERTISSDTKLSGGTNFTFGNPPVLKVDNQPSNFTFQPKPTLFSNSSLSSVPSSTVSNPIFKFDPPTTTTGKMNDKVETAEILDTPKTTAPGFNFSATPNSITSFTVQNKEEKPVFGYMNEKPKSSNTEIPSIFNSAVESKDKTPFESMQNKSLATISGSKNEMGSIFGANTESKPTPFGMESSEDKKVPFFGSSNSGASKPVFFNSNVIGEINKAVFGGAQSDWKPNFNASVEPAAFRAPAPATTTSTFSGFGTSTPVFTSTEQNPPAPFAFNTMPNQTPSQVGFPFKAETENKPQGFPFAAPATTQSSGGFSFSVPQTTTANSFRPTFTASPAPPPNPPPVFGGANPVFGSSAPSPFPFGAPPQQSEPQQTVTPVFNFSSGQPQTTAAPNTPSFAFGSQNAAGPAATPAFNPNIKPTFNFTGGATPAFSATPTAPVLKHTDRKIRRAVRRTQNR